LAFFPLSVAFILATIPEEELCRVLMHRICPLAHWLQGYHRVITIITFCMGIFIGVYTGVLLSSFVARPLWNSAMLPALFLTSALSSGAALMIIVARRKAVKLFFTKVDVILIAAEILILCLFFYGQYTSSAAHRASILPFFSLNQEFFWYGASIILIGIVLPGALVMKLMEVTEGHGDELSSSAVLTMNLSALLVIAGGLIIRLAFVYAGQLSAFS
ncbi:MAG TPA: NrfD/PsrC family molybdoenzyme membrane anchor subunit, partial [Geobacterales bacterium]|nr:NrfD/PsrC family molybdoenzyme membrane anchor subunit [Geobacterales bacterium]